MVLSSRCFIIKLLFLLEGSSCSCWGLFIASNPPSHLLAPTPTSSAANTQIIRVSSFESNAISWLLINTEATAAIEPSWSDQIKYAKRYKTDKVKRVIDSSTVQLEKGGYVSLESVRGAGSTYQLPDCMDRAPSYKLKQLLPKGAAVRLVNLDDLMMQGNNDGGSKTSSSSSTPRVWMVRVKDELLINEELVRNGFAFVRKGGGNALPDMINDLMKLEEAAKAKGLGIYKTCTDDGAIGNTSSNTAQTSNFVAEFEPLDYTTEIQYGDDGGKSVVVSRKDALSSAKPNNPGDTKGCSDFSTYEDSLGYYEKYFPFYGDVARLDRDGDGVPCPGLPHTTVAEKYRMKIPKNGGA